VRFPGTAGLDADSASGKGKGGAFRRQKRRFAVPPRGDLVAMSQTQFTFAGQIGTHFGLTFNPAFNVYPIDTGNIAKFYAYII
jgi:hypothetical protein